MKYHDHEIRIVPADLGEEDPKDNRIYEIRKDGEKIAEALTLSTAKTFIDNGYDQRYL